jgi:hypothetical protein
MNVPKLIIIAIITLTIAACSASKKSASSGPSTPVPSTTQTTPSSNYLLVKPEDGIHAPGNEELTAIRVQYNDSSLERLKEGHAIYIGATCVRCHEAKSIYALETAKWKGVLEDMAQKANISDIQKDAVYKYVLAIKATQPK